MAELGNLIARILLPLWRMSTVKIRTGSLFRTSTGSNFGCRSGFSHSSPRFSSDLHNPSPSFTGCTQRVIRSGLREVLPSVQSRRRKRKSIELKGPGD
jgi:hypothetical protein